MDSISGTASSSIQNISGTLSSSGISVSGFISQKVLQGLSAYQIAVANGFEGTQQEWIQSLRGDKIQFYSEGLKIYYKYEGDDEWNLLVEIDQLMADYSVLANKPSINSIELDGDKTLDELGIQAKGDYVETQEGYSMVSDEEIERLSDVYNYDDTEIKQAIQAIILAAVTGVKGAAEQEYRIGDVNITPENIGLGNVENTADADKNVLSAVQDSEGNDIHETYFSGISKAEDGSVYFTRPDGSSEIMLDYTHTHDASEITSGTIDIARLPAGALERLIDVANKTERFALTTDTVQNGDTVRQIDTGVMYRVVDDTKLNTAAGYKEYTAGRASAVSWSGIEDKPETFTPSAHTHTISEVIDITNASVAEATKLKTPRNISISGGATAQAVAFDGSGNVILTVTDLDASILSGIASIDTTGNAATATKLAKERTIQVVGKATASPKVFDGTQNIALEITDLDAAEKEHTHTLSEITDYNESSINAATAETINNMETSNTDNYSDIWFGDPQDVSKPVHNSGIQYNPVQDTLKVGTVDGDLTGNANTANALNTDAGSSKHPVYFIDGKPVQTTYELNATVPADAKFTDEDTHYESDLIIAGNFNSKTNSATSLSNGNVYINHIENNAITSSHRISGINNTSVTTDEYGNIIIDSTSEEYTAGNGIDITNYVVTNSGVRSISESTENGNITANVNGTAKNIPITGLKSAAYTESTDYATADHNHDFSELKNTPTTLEGYGITDAANSVHEHDASEITSGVIDIARIPAAALERLVVVADETERFALTTNQVQVGDTVQQEDTKVMYRVIDDTKLNSASGYKEYTAGSASSVPWQGVTGKPDTYPPSIHTHQYAGSSEVGGAANSAVKLESSAGSATNPVYFSDGKPVVIDYSINKSVPADAEFTDTHYQSSTIINSSEDSTKNATRSITNGNVFINHVEDGTVKSSHRIQGTGIVTVSYSVDGDLIINGTSQKYTTLPNPYPLNINGSSYDGSETVDVGIIDVAHGGTGHSSIDASPTIDSTKMVTSGGVYNALLGKSSTDHTHLYAGSSTSGGSATSAEKLTSDAGSTTQPVYFSSGKPVATSYEVKTTVPENAVFTDTHHVSGSVVTRTSSGTQNSTTSVSNGSLFLNHIENGEVRSSHRISGTGSVTVKSDTSGNIIINAEDTKYTSLPNPYALSINGISYDGTEAVDVGVIDVLHGGTGNTSADTTPVENSTKMVTSGGIYSALEEKAQLNHTHLYAGSVSAGGSANSAIKLDSDAGSPTQPVYFSGGKPASISYTIGTSVPSNAVFTDTHYNSKTVVSSSATETTDTTTSLSNSRVLLNHVENDSVVSSHRISGTGSATVTTDSSGNIIINAEDTKYTNLPNPYALTIQGNGTNLGSYSGASEETINITYSNVGAAAESHTHTWSELTTHPTTLAGYGITDQIASKTHIHDASEIQSGVLDISRIPVAALERLIVVADEAEMYALTTDTVQIGDTVQLEDTGVMYRVVDEDNLDNASGYKEYTAGTASSVPWAGITGKPDTYTPSAHTHLYAGSSSVGGSATSAIKLDSDAGSSVQPVYFSGGKPTATTYSLNATVPSNAVFTDTHYEAKNVVGGARTDTSDTTTTVSNGSVFLNLVQNDLVKSSHRITGSDAVAVTTDTSGNIVISAHDSKYTVLPNPYALVIETNGTQKVSYTGLEQKTINITYEDVGAAAAEHGTHVTYSETNPAANGTPSPGTASTVARSDHVHPLQTSVSGNAGSANKLNTAITISLTGSVTGSVVFDGSANVEIPTTTNHTHLYAGSTVAGGIANSSLKLVTDSDAGYSVGASDSPVYFSNGLPVQISEFKGNSATASKLLTARTIQTDLSSDQATYFNGDSNTTPGVTGVLSVEHGGTGISSITENGLLYGDGTNAIQILAPGGSAGMVLTTNGASAPPSWAMLSSINVGAASKLVTSRTIQLVVAEGAFGGVTGSVSTNFEDDVIIDTTLSSHQHDAAEDITSGVLPIVRGGTGYNTIDTTPTAGSDHVVKSSGVHKRIAYKRILLSNDDWVVVTEGYGQAIVATDVKSSTEIVSVKCLGNLIDEELTESYTNTFTGDGATDSFLLTSTPTEMGQVTVASVASTAYTITGNTIQFDSIPEQSAEISVSYTVSYSYNDEYSGLSQVETGNGKIIVTAHSRPQLDLTIVVGYVSEELETLSTQTTIE